MTDLFGQQYRSGAELSPDRKFRYALWRIWGDGPIVMFIGLNPSKATENRNDPTIRRVIGFARRWGMGGVYMLNLFPLVTPDPKVLEKWLVTDMDTDHHTFNRSWLTRTGKRAQRVILAWGSFQVASERGEAVAAMFPHAEALAINADGSPRHPLYVPGQVEPVKFHRHA